jgi:uncharacterized membrane protein YecN with MAPEG domain
MGPDPVYCARRAGYNAPANRSNKMDIAIMVTITALFAGILSLLYIWLSIQVIRTRRIEKVSLGDGGNKKVRRAMRAQANFAEYTPLALLLMGLAELQGATAWWVLVIGLVLLAGRSIHAYGFLDENENLKLRVRAMQCTFTAITAGAVTNLVLSVF